MRRAFVCIVFAAVLAGCTSDSGARRALSAAGYTNVTLGGFAWLSCSQDDQFRTRFSATGPNGQPATGAVCGGWFKGSTIRLD